MSITYEQGYIDTDPTMAGNSDHNTPSQSALFTALKPISVYKGYQAIVTQSGTSAPTATVYYNKLGATLTWGRTSAGLYTITAGSAVFTANKTVIILSQPLVGLVSYIVVPTSTTVITLTTLLSSVIATVLSATATDNLITNLLVEIRVYI